MNVYLLLILDVFFAVGGHLLIKKGALSLKNLDLTLNNIFNILPEIIKNPYLIFGLSSYGLSFILWTLVLSKIKINVAYPISVGLIITFITIGAYIFHHESITLLQIVGIVIIMLGIFMILSTT